MVKFCAKCGCVIEDESHDYCKYCLEDIDSKPIEHQFLESQKGQQVTIQNKSIFSLDSMFITLAYTCLASGIIATLVLFITIIVEGLDLSTFLFILCLIIGSIISFAVFKAFAVFVKAANKYLTDK